MSGPVCLVDRCPEAANESGLCPVHERQYEKGGIVCGGKLLRKTPKLGRTIPIAIALDKVLGGKRGE